MKNIILLFTALLISGSINTLWSQEDRLLEIVNEIIPIQVALSFASDEPSLEPKYKPTPFFDKPSIAINSGDLKLRFQLNPQQSRKSAYYIEIVSIHNFSTGKDFPLLQENIYGDVGKVPIKKTIEIILANDAANTNPLLLTGKVLITLNIKQIEHLPIYGKFWRTEVYCDECDNGIDKLKIFKFKRGRGTTLVGAGTTLGLALGSQFFWSKSRTAYKGYRTNYQTKAAAQPAYNDAVSKYNTSKNFKTVAIIAAGATIAWTAIQQWGLQRERKITSCNGCANDKSDFCEKYKAKRARKYKRKLGSSTSDKK